jgi:hypothetical protein
MPEIREDLGAAHARAWLRLAAPGAWQTGAEKVAIAAEARAALHCPACAQRKAALSPEQPIQAHAGPSGLDTALVDLIHRIRTDADRLTPAWFARVVPSILSVEQYVETVGIIAEVTAVDSFMTAMGMPLWPLPAPLAGKLTGVRPKAAKLAGAWVPTVAPEDISTDDPEPVQAMYRNRSAANIHRALSLVPEAVNGFFDLDDAMYLPDALLRKFEEEPRAITHAQIELLAARVSALNRCLY